MTVSSSSPGKVTGNGNGSAFDFSFSPMVIYAATDLVVTYVDADGNETTLTKGTGASNYSVTVSAYPGTGEITYPADESTPIASGTSVVIKRQLPIEQTVNLSNQSGYYPDVLEKALDKLVILARQQQEELDRTPKFAVSVDLSSFDLDIPALTASKVVAINAAGTGFELLPTPTAAVTAAEAAQAAAEAAQTAAETAQTSAETAETNAAASQTAAAASAAAAAASAASNLFNTVVTKANADSPYTVVSDIDDGTLFICNMTSGNLTMTLPSIATAGEGERYGFLRSGGSNTLTLARNGSDTINGVAGNYTVTANDGELVVLVADDATPDNWVTTIWTQAVADGTTLSKTGSTISIANGGVDTTQLADDAVDPTKAIAGRNAQTDTTYILALADNLKLVTFSNASAVAVTVPTNVSVAAPADETRIDLANIGAGTVTVTGDTGVTINGVSAGSFTLAQYAGASLFKIDTNTWLCLGATVA